MKLEELYPDLKPADIYFTMGAMRSPGSALNGHVLIGSEFAFADEHTVSSKFSERVLLYSSKKMNWSMYLPLF